MTNEDFIRNTYTATDLRYQIRGEPMQYPAESPREISEIDTIDIPHLQQRWIKENCEDVWLDVPYTNESEGKLKKSGNDF